MIGKMPTTEEITRALINVQAYDLSADDPWIDVRLQVIPSESMDWAIRVGDAQYDTDHRGAWGASSIDKDYTIDQLREVAKDLIDQAEEMLGDE